MDDIDEVALEEEVMKEGLEMSQGEDIKGLINAIER